jgi:hypothetical protein
MENQIESLREVDTADWRGAGRVSRKWMDWLIVRQMEAGRVRGGHGLEEKCEET